MALTVSPALDQDHRKTHEPGSHDPEIDQKMGWGKKTIAADPANVTAVTNLLMQHLERARNEPVSETELESSIGYLVGGTVVGLESGSVYAGQLAHNTSLGLPLTTAELEAGLRSVSRDDIQRVAREYLAPERLTRVVVAPAE